MGDNPLQENKHMVAVGMFFLTFFGRVHCKMCCVQGSLNYALMH